MKKVKLGEIAEITSSKRIFASDYVSSGIPFFRGKEISQKEKGENITDLLFISREKYEKIKSSYPVPEKGDILLTSVGSIGIPYLVDDEEFYFKDGNLTWFRNLSDKIDSKFLYYWMLSNEFKQQVFNNKIGAVQKALTIINLQELIITLPNLSTQTVIGKVLSSLDEKIELNNKINKELEAMAKSLYDYWFVQNADDSWKRTKINDLFKKYTDTSVRIDAKNIQKEGKYPVITQDVGDLVKGYTNEDHPISDLPAIIFGDHSCTLRYIDFPFFRGADGTQLMYFENKKIINYIYYCMSKLIPYLPNFGKYERHFKYLKDFEILVPPTDLIDNFNNFVTPIFSQINFNRNENYTLSQLRDYLLPLLMNGQVQVDDIDNKTSKKLETKKQDYYNQRFELWLENQKLAARGNIDRQTLREIFDAMDDDDK